MMTFIALGINFLSSFLLLPADPPAVHLEVMKVQLHQLSGNMNGKELARFTMKLNGDFRPLFNWNTKQLFLYVSANYSVDGIALSQQTVWDRVVQRHEQERALFDNETVESISERKKTILGIVDEHLKDTEVTLTLHYNVVPVGGALRWGTSAELRLRLPSVLSPPLPSPRPTAVRPPSDIGPLRQP